jgi:hypothetical protein
VDPGPSEHVNMHAMPNVANLCPGITTPKTTRQCKISALGFRLLKAVPQTQAHYFVTNYPSIYIFWRCICISEAPVRVSLSPGGPLLEIMWIPTSPIWWTVTAGKPIRPCTYTNNITLEPAIPSLQASKQASKQTVNRSHHHPLNR